MSSQKLDEAFYAIWCSEVQDGEEQRIYDENASTMFGKFSSKVRLLLDSGDPISALRQLAKERMTGKSAKEIASAAKAWVTEFFPFESDDPDDRADTQTMRLDGLETLRFGISQLR